MLAGLSKEEKQKLELEDASTYKYLTGVSKKLYNFQFYIEYIRNVIYYILH